MRNPLYFSDHFKYIAAKLKFIFSITARFIAILFKKRKRIELIRLDYSRKYLFDKSYLALSYKFKNALWYKFKNLKQTTEKELVFFNLEKLDSNDIVLIVYGFFQKKTYRIEVSPEKRLEAKSFRTRIVGIKEKKTIAAISQRTTLFKINKKISVPSAVELGKRTLLVSIPTVKHPKSKIKIRHSSYNQTDFI